MANWVVFDLGGVLVSVAKDWRDVLEHLNLEAPDRSLDFGDCPAFLGYQRGEVSEQDYLQDLAAFLYLEEPKHALAAHNSILRGEFDESFSLVAEFQEAGFKSACLSNTNELHWNVLADQTTFPALNSLQLKLASHQMKLEKPNQAIYQEAERRLGATPNEILFFDDGIANVTAAQQAGWNAHHIDPGPHAATQMRAIFDAIRT